MNQFKEYEEKLKKCSKAMKIADDFDYILNNIWCTYSFHKGKKKWREIARDIPESFRCKISIEMGHVWLGHGIDQARLEAKSAMKKYLDYLLSGF